MRPLALVVPLLSCAAAISAQSDRGSITGAIADPTGGVISGAKVEAKNVGTSATYEVGSSATGNYVFARNSYWHLRADGNHLRI